MDVQQILDRLQGVVREKSGWRALCPAHEDHDPSLAISEGKDGRVLLNCRSHQCTPEQITSAIGLTVHDLFHGNGDRKPAPVKPRAFGKPIATYEYHDEQGRVLYRVERDEQKNFRQSKPSHLEPPANPWTYSIEGVRRVPYKLPEVLAARQLKIRIHIVEGEKDADTLAALGLCATTNSGGAGRWTEDLSALIAGADDVAILHDNDPPGLEGAQKIATQLKGKVRQLRLVTLPDLPEKGDVTDFLEQGKNAADLTRIIDAAPMIKDPARLFLDITMPSSRFRAATFPRPRSLLGDGVFSAGDLGILYGRPGLGKTWFMLQAMVALSRAEKAFGLTPAEGDPIRIGILELELGGFQLQERLLRIQGDLRDQDENLEIVCRPELKGAVNIRNDEQWKAWGTWVTERRFDLIVIDALSRAHDADENKAVEIGPVLQRLDELRFETGCAILAIHHERKPQGGRDDDDMDALRASSRLQSDANCLIRLKASGDRFFTLRDRKSVV